MNEAAQLVEQITLAFAAAQYPGDGCLRRYNLGEEPYLLEKEFKGKTDWRSLDPEFLDQAPDGYGSALSFFSDEAFRFYLPAYMLADIREQLGRSTPVFHLTYGLDDLTRGELVNDRRYGQLTWFEEASHRFAKFSRDEAAAIVAYLLFKREADPLERDTIDQALRNYWNERTA
jgi:hypothetical protein